MYPSPGLGGSSNGDSLHVSASPIHAFRTHARCASSSDNIDALLPRRDMAGAPECLGVVDTERLGECLNPLPAPRAPCSSGDWVRSGADRISGEAEGDVCLEPGGEGDGTMFTS